MYEEWYYYFSYYSVQQLSIIIVHTSMVWDDVQSKTGIVFDAMDERLTVVFLS